MTGVRIIVEAVEGNDSRPAGMVMFPMADAEGEALDLSAQKVLSLVTHVIDAVMTRQNIVMFKPQEANAQPPSEG